MKKLMYCSILAVATLSLSASATKLTVAPLRTVYCEGFSATHQKQMKAAIARNRGLNELGAKAEAQLQEECFSKGGVLDISRRQKSSCDEENIFTQSVCVLCSVTLTGNCIR